MSTLWSQPSSSPLDWPAVPILDNSTLLPPDGESWYDSGVPITTQNMEALDAATWPTVTGSVDLGLSPVLSHESQSTRTLNSFSEPDAYALPPGLDLSYPRAPSWHEPGVYTSPDVSSQMSPAFAVPCSFDQSGLSIACSASPSTALYPGSFPVFYPHGGQAAYSRHIPHMHNPPMRPLLPRSEAQAVPSQPAYGPQRMLRPSVPGSCRSHVSSRNVSNSAALPQESPRKSSSQAAPQTTPVVSSGAISSFSSVPDPNAEEFNSFIRFDHDDHPLLNGQSRRVYERDVSTVASFVPESRAFPANTSVLGAYGKPAVSDRQVDGAKLSESDLERATVTSHSSETDEGRHRTHPDYSKPPHSDGLYRCPYKAKENCSHKPTKLKCNYDKFIDSHVKPFRCKLEACSKQEFSSTACLLRHEREAHGMHGHGDRPHLCYYTGCERGVQGNGFPRRYNLFDHMKRVHDHKEDAVDATGSPILGGETQKKIKGAKRKPSSPLASEASVQRQKTVGVSHQPRQTPAASPELYYHGQGYYPQGHGPDMRYAAQQNSRMSFSQWASNGICHPAE